MAMAVHDSSDMTKLWPVGKRLRRDDFSPAAAAAAAAGTATTTTSTTSDRTITTTNAHIPFRVHSKWRQRGERGASPAAVLFDDVAGDDGRKRVGVIFTGHKVRPRTRRRRLLSRITASAACPIQQCPYQTTTTAEGQIQEKTEEKPAPFVLSCGASSMAATPNCYEGQNMGVADPLWIIRRLPAPLELPASPATEVLEAELRLLFNQMVRKGESVFRFCRGAAPGSEHIECSDVLTAWVFRLLKDGQGDTFWQELIERLVYKVLFEYIMKLHCGANYSNVGRISSPVESRGCNNSHEKALKEPLLDMLTWLKGVAVDLYSATGSATSWGRECRKWRGMNVSGRCYPPPSTWNSVDLNECPGEDNDVYWWDMVLSSREVLFMKPEDGLQTEVHSYHLKGETADSPVSTSAVPILCRRRLVRSLALLKLSDFGRKRVPIGPSFQVDVPKWKGERKGRVIFGEDEDSRWLGTQIWPIAGGGFVEAGQEAIGRGRVESCACPFPSSVSCVRYHVSVGRCKMRRNLGQAFKGLGLEDMGEEACSGSWTMDEQSIFGALVKLNPLSKYKSFWGPALKFFGYKSRQDIVNYYFNVFLLRRIGIQTRFISGDADSDDDEVNVDGYEDLYPKASPEWYS